jgi:hypothetical protein
MKRVRGLLLALVMMSVSLVAVWEIGRSLFWR